MTEPSEDDCWHTDELVCPYCGHEHECSYDMIDVNKECGETTCGECDKDFYYVRTVSISYSTKKLEMDA